MLCERVLKCCGAALCVEASRGRLPCAGALLSRVTDSTLLLLPSAAAPTKPTPCCQLLCCAGKFGHEFLEVEFRPDGKVCVVWCGACERARETERECVL